MSRLHTLTGMSLVAGLVGGMISRLLFVAPPVALAQTQRREEPSVIRAERIELVNNRGTPLAVFEVSYSAAVPEGSPMLTLTDKDVLRNQERKVRIGTATSSFTVGDKDSLFLAAGMVMVRNAGGTDWFGLGPLNGRPPSQGNGLVISSSAAGETILNGAQITVSDRNGLPVATLP